MTNMTTYKAICTLTWKFDSNQSHSESLEYAKNQLDTILETNPHGFDFENFLVQVDLAKMKDRKKLIHLGEFSLDDVFPYITIEDEKRQYTVKGKEFQIRMNSDRYFVFKANNCCVSCGIEGTKMILDLNPGDQSPHFNLYAIENGRLVLMTKDHIIPKSKGGQDIFENYATMCAICNNLKGNYNLEWSQINQLRKIDHNEDKLPRKELRNLINKIREEMALKNDLT